MNRGTDKAKETAVTAEISLREVREYYAAATRLLTFMNILFILVISGLGIYIADIMSGDEADDAKVFCLYTVFIIGAVLSFLLIIACIMGRKGEYEAALKLRRLLSVIAAVIGVLSFGVSLVTILQTCEKWEDGYTAAVFLIQLAGSILAVVCSITIFVLAHRGSRCYDSKKLAKDIPDGMTVEKNNKKYMLFRNISQIILSASVYLLALYFANEINAYSVQSYADYGKYEQVYRYIFVIGMVLCAALFIAGIIMQVFKDKRLCRLNAVIFIITVVLEAVFAVYSLLNISQRFVKANRPDVTYIVFGIILTIISAFILLKKTPASASDR